MAQRQQRMLTVKIVRRSDVDRIHFRVRRQAFVANMPAANIKAIGETIGGGLCARANGDNFLVAQRGNAGRKLGGDVARPENTPAKQVGHGELQSASQRPAMGMPLARVT